MKIRNFVRESYNDFSGKIATTVFTPGCNYRCPACHAKQILEKGENKSEEEFFKYLDSRKGWIQGVCISGGEPTLQWGLKYFAMDLKERGLLVKLDTNGSNYIKLGELLEEKLVDYVAMDVKGPGYIYAPIVGREFLDERDDYGKAIAVVSQFPDYEFRTTVVPIVRRNNKISFMTAKEIGETAELIWDWTGRNNHKYFLQPFVPRKDGLLDARLESFPETPKEILEEGALIARKILPRCELR